MADSEAAPDRRTFEAHLKLPRFRCGVEEGRWAVLNAAFPHLYVRVSAVDRDTEIKAVFDFHLLCDGYPMPGPFVERWDSVAQARGAAPTANNASPGIVDALKDWDPSGGVHGGIYRAWQRHAGAHNGWVEKRPDEAWHRERDLAFVMERLYDLVAEQALWLASKQAA